jgi:hypothetical protein
LEKGVAGSLEVVYKVIGSTISSLALLPSFERVDEGIGDSLKKISKYRGIIVLYALGS